MEVVIVTLWMLLFIHLWILSCSVLLPFVILLKYSRKFRHIWFSWFYTRMMGPYLQSKMLPLRKQCFSLFKRLVGKRDETVPLKILEIGVGNGANLQFYPPNSSLIAVDVNPSFEAYFAENRKKYPQVKLERMVHAMAEDMKEVADNSVDVVISTYVLCYVQDIDAVLKEVKRVLVDGGKFVFLEHVVIPRSQWGFTLQKMVAPLWILYTAGCHPNRDITSHLDAAQFSKVIYERLDSPSIQIFVRPHIIGVAFK